MYPILKCMEPSPTEEKIREKMQEFIYYFVKRVETKLEYYSKILNPNLSTEATGTTIGRMLSPIAKDVSSETLSYAVEKLDRKYVKREARKKALAFREAIEFYKRNAEAFRIVLVKASYEIFCCFEKQLLSFMSHKKSIWLIADLGQDVARRFMLFMYKNGKANATVESVIGSIVFNNWKFKNNLSLLIKSPSDGKSNTHHIYREAAVNDKEARKGYRNEFSNIPRHGFRLKFSKEQVANWNEIEVTCNYIYVTDIKRLEAHLEYILEYIATKYRELLSPEERNQEQIIKQNEVLIKQNEQIMNFVALNKDIDEKMKYLNKDQNLLYDHFDLPLAPIISYKRNERNDILKELCVRLPEEGTTEEVEAAKEAMIDIIPTLKYCENQNYTAIN